MNATIKAIPSIIHMLAPLQQYTTFTQLGYPCYPSAHPGPRGKGQAAPKLTVLDKEGKEIEVKLWEQMIDTYGPALRHVADAEDLSIFAILNVKAESYSGNPFHPLPHLTHGISSRRPLRCPSPSFRLKSMPLSLTPPLAQRLEP